MSRHCPSCTLCGEPLPFTLQSIFESVEDEDRNRYFRVECKRKLDACRPVIIRDGGTGAERAVIAHVLDRDG